MGLPFQTNTANNKCASLVQLTNGAHFYYEFKAIPHKDRLTALRTSCLQLFRQIAPNHLEIRQYSCGVLIQSDEKSDSAIRTQSLCGIALKIYYFSENNSDKAAFSKVSELLTDK